MLFHCFHIRFRSFHGRLCSGRLSEWDSDDVHDSNKATRTWSIRLATNHYRQ
jgi:hypothetical protein